MKLLLSRHGNTFSPGDKVVWTGSRNDLPLVTEGVEQAERLAEVLIHKKIIPKAIFCSPLKRTQAYAQVILDRLDLNLPLQIDSRLNEIDYGDWTGLTNTEVVGRYGEAPLESWENESRWPTQSGWTGTENQIIAEVKSFVREIAERYQEDDWILIVTSNGRLRYFLSLIDGELEKRVREKSFKVKTGHICQIDFLKKVYALRYWGQVPSIKLPLE